MVPAAQHTQPGLTLPFTTRSLPSVRTFKSRSLKIRADEVPPRTPGYLYISEVSSCLSQHFPCSLVVGRDSNTLTLKGQRSGPQVLASFPGTGPLLPFLSLSTGFGDVAGRSPGQQGWVWSGWELSASCPCPWLA